VHGFIGYDELEERLINSRAVQRLRGISQLALTSYVYPGARHSRFEHSLGVMHVASRIADQVGLSDEERKLVRLAGLLHDIGHGPFSHVSDVPLAVLTTEAETLPSGLPPSKIHEQITVDLIRYNGELASILGKSRREVVAAILDTMASVRQPLLRQIVSGPLDADKLDYLLRDGLLAGVRYGVIDLERVIDCFTTIGKDERHLAIRRDGIEAAEQVVLARYQMTRQVYTHRVRRITNAMLHTAILAATRDCRRAGKAVRGLYTYRQGDQDWLAEYVHSDDFSLLAQLGEFPETSKVGKLLSRLRRRQLLKQVYERRLRDLPGAGAAARDKLVKDTARQDKLAARLAERLHADADLVIVDIRSQDNPLYRPPEVPLEADIRVVDEKGLDERLGNMPESLSETVRVEPEAGLFVYAPVDEPERAKREKRYRHLEKECNCVIETWFKEAT
jgi:hypothetical protein